MKGKVMKPLTPKQARLLAFVNDQRNWKPPTWESIQAHMGFRHSESVRSMLSLIRNKGYFVPSEGAMIQKPPRD